MSKKLQCVYVEWDDSNSHHGWTPFAELAKNTNKFLCKSVGFVVNETKDHLHIASHVYRDDTDNPTGDGSMCIPKAIIKVRKKVNLK